MYTTFSSLISWIRFTGTTIASGLDSNIILTVAVMFGRRFSSWGRATSTLKVRDKRSIVLPTKVTSASNSLLSSETLTIALLPFLMSVTYASEIGAWILSSEVLTI